MKKRKSKNSLEQILLNILGFILIASMIIVFASAVTMDVAGPKIPFIENKVYSISEQVSKISAIVFGIDVAILFVSAILSMLYEKYEKMRIILIAGIVIAPLIFAHFIYNTITYENYNYKTVEVAEVRDKTLLVEYQDNGDLTSKEIKKPLMSSIKKGSEIEVRYKNSLDNMEYGHPKKYYTIGLIISSTLLFIFIIMVPIVVLPSKHYNDKKTIKNVEKKQLQ